ncbi:STM4012 family radical SAM protein [Nannocystaceae bacterium ST9]
MTSAEARNEVRGYGREPRVVDVGELLRGSPFLGYSYAYPHKTAYRPLAEPRPLAEVWAEQDRSRLFLYVHVPFCAVRCGFCNLFTQKHPPAELPAAWQATLDRQIAVVRRALPDARFARWAIGGGTPTLLEADALARIFDRLADAWPIDFAATPGSVETSPETCTDDRLAVLERMGTRRISIGIQSFDADELRSLGRPQAVTLGEAALDRIRRRRFARLNLDLIYGIAGQTPASFEAAIRRALDWRPEELYLYPLYQRPLTGLGLRGRSWDDQRAALLEHGRDYLLAHGYRQVSMRMFERIDDTQREPGPVYCCQADGMIGLGVGARSYTRTLHYSDAWAVGSAGVRSIVADWIARTDEQLGRAWYGIELDGEEQRRRWLIQSLLQREGLDFADYRRRFASEALDDFHHELAGLLEHGLLARTREGLIPTARGLAWSDAIGPWLYSDASRAASQEFELR